ncbi:MAG: hemerythrin domain-containing protein [Desulfuromonadaceae bacterium]|nr:hemerythrin domain-containing protein [Desulfuromonadaceae bacterium]
MSDHPFIQHLKKDHEKQKQLGKELSESTDLSIRKEVRQQLYEALYPHIMGEEASFFAYLTKSSVEDIRDQALEGLQEHHVAKIVLKELMKLNIDSDVFKAKAKVLDELNRHHIEEEEGGLFKVLQKMSTQDLDELFKKYEETEEKEK